MKSYDRFSVVCIIIRFLQEQTEPISFSTTESGVTRDMSTSWYQFIAEFKCITIFVIYIAKAYLGFEIDLVMCLIILQLLWTIFKLLQYVHYVFTIT